MHGGGNAVNLCNRADTERGEQAEHAKQNGQPFLMEPFFYVIHRAADPFPFFVFVAEINAQNDFGVFGHHAEKGRHPHPENCTGTARGNRRCHTDNVARADCGGKRGRQRLKLGNRLVVTASHHAFITEHGKDCIFHRVAELGNLEKARADGQIHADRQKQHKHRNTPHHIVDRRVNLFNFRNQFLHNSPPPNQCSYCNTPKRPKEQKNTA